MHYAMQAAGATSTLEITEEGGHGGPPDSKQLMVAFFQETLAK